MPSSTPRGFPVAASLSSTSPDQHHQDSSSTGPPSHSEFPTDALTVGLLEPGTGTWTTELLGLAAAVVGNEEGTVELGQGLLEQVLGVLIDELLVVGDQSLGDCLSDGAISHVSTPENPQRSGAATRSSVRNRGTIGDTDRRSHGARQRTRSGKCDHHRRHGHGCRGRRTCRGRRRAGARRP